MVCFSFSNLSFDFVVLAGPTKTHTFAAAHKISWRSAKSATFLLKQLSIRTLNSLKLNGRTIMQVERERAAARESEY